MKIDRYSFGELVIDGELHAKDVLLLPPNALSPWWRQQGHSLVMADLAAVMSYQPQLLIIGTGAHERMVVPGTTAEQLEGAVDELLIMATPRACEEFNRRRTDGIRLAAALHLTC